MLKFVKGDHAKKHKQRRRCGLVASHALFDWKSSNTKGALLVHADDCRC